MMRTRGKTTSVLRWLAFGALLGASLTSAASTLLKSDFQLGGQWRVNSTARLLSGLPPWYPGHHALAQSEAWKEHSAAMQSVWAQVRSGRVTAMSAWREEQFPASCPAGKTLLYPFSGPDFFNAYWLFPECDTFLLFGLEHIGEVPEVEAMSERDFGRLLVDVRAATADLFSRNYFITENMTRQLHTPQLRGVLPLVVISMALSGMEILRILPQDLGRVAPAPGESAAMAFPGADAPAKTFSLRKPRGVAIEFRAPGSAALKRLVYFSVDATDSSLARYPEFLSYVRKLEPTTTLLKSASYLLHSRQFSRLRNTLLDVSGFLVQDDSGLPYRLLISRGWQVRLHGNYAVPIPPFEGAFQPALHAAYQAQHPESLPFAFGYSFQDQRDNRANLMVGRRPPVPHALATSARTGQTARLKYSGMQGTLSRP